MVVLITPTTLWAATSCEMCDGSLFICEGGMKDPLESPIKLNLQVGFRN